MKRFVMSVLCTMLLFSQDAFSRRSGGSSFSSSRSSRSYSRPVSKKTSTAPRKSTTTVKKATTKTQAKPKAIAKTSTSKKISKKEALAAKKYGNKKNATSSFRKEQAKNYKNKFEKEPAKRPEYIPSSVSRGGVSHNVTFYNGSYGYYNMVNGVRTWMLLDMATDMMVTDAMLRSHGYGVYGAGGTPVVYQSPIPKILFGAIFGTIGLIVVVALVKSIFF